MPNLQTKHKNLKKYIKKINAIRIEIVKKITKVKHTTRVVTFKALQQLLNGNKRQCLNSMENKK